MYMHIYVFIIYINKSLLVRVEEVEEFRGTVTRRMRMRLYICIYMYICIYVYAYICIYYIYKQIPSRPCRGDRIAPWHCNKKE